MNAFFDGVGKDYAAGVWEALPEDRPQFKERMKKRGSKATAKTASKLADY